MYSFEGQQQQREEWRNDGGRIKLAFRSRRLVEQRGPLKWISIPSGMRAQAELCLFLSTTFVLLLSRSCLRFLRK